MLRTYSRNLNFEKCHPIHVILDQLCTSESIFNQIEVKRIQTNDLEENGCEMDLNKVS